MKMKLPGLKLIIFFSLGLLIGFSTVRFSPRLAYATDFIFGTDSDTGDFVVKEKGGNVKLRIDSTGSLIAPLKYSPTGENMVQNGGFEMDVQSLGATTPNPINWTKNFHTQGAGNTLQYYVTSTDMREGIQSMKIETASTGDGSSVASDAFGVIPGKTYTVSVDAKDTSTCASGFYLRMFYYASDDTISNPGAAAIGATGYTKAEVITGDSATTTSWATYSGDVTVPSGNGCAGSTKPCTQARLAVYNWGVACTRYLDNAKVITAGTGGTISSANVSAGTFGSNTGDGNFTFPANLTVDTDTLFVDSASNYVGIGTTGPAAKLDIAAASSTVSNVSGDITISPNNNFIISSGSVGIGTTTPAHKIDVVGTAGLSTGTAWTNTSDRRYKNIQEELKGSSLNKIMTLRPISFEWNSLHDSKYGKDPGLNYGFIAQEVAQVIPEFVTKDNQGFYWYNPSGIEAILTASIQEQQNGIESFSNKLNELSARVESQQKQIEELKAENNQLKQLVCLDHPEADICQ